MSREIIPSIIAKNQNELNKRFEKIGDISKKIHLDVMDGKFVKNKSLNFDFKKPQVKLNYVFHLMVKDPKTWIRKNWEKTDEIIFHVESIMTNDQVTEIIKMVKIQGKKVGIAISPKTDVTRLEPFLPKINSVLVMSVEPGKYGGKFLPETLDKILKIKKMNSRVKIGVDGGMDEKNLMLAKKKKADFFISGSYIQNSKSPREALETLKSIIK